MKNFLYIEYNNGIASENILYNYLMKNGLKERVDAVFKQRQERKKIIQDCHRLNSDFIREQSESEEQSRVLDNSYESDGNGSEDAEIDLNIEEVKLNALNNVMISKSNPARLEDHQVVGL